jgi:hypothetical protein
MSEMRTGVKAGVPVNATIRKYNGDGTVSLSIDTISLGLPNYDIVAPLPTAWLGNNAFLAGYPDEGTTVKIIQGHGGSWTIIQASGSNQFINDSDFVKNTLVGKVKDGSKFVLSPKSGIFLGKDKNNIKLNPNQELLTINVDSEYTFTNSQRKISGNIKRDLRDTSNRNLLTIDLDNHKYESNLFEICLDPSLTASHSTVFGNIRNLPLTETREIVYEYSNDYDFISFNDELNRYKDTNFVNETENSRRKSRTDVLSLNLEYPNYLIESIKGTVVDLFGNILDINKNILPIGKVPDLSLKDSKNVEKNYINIQKEFRKSIAFHWEMNARKELGEELLPPNPDLNSDYSRNRSKFAFTIDKEGQIKWNIPASSETGNIGLLVRDENYSTLLSKQNSNFNPNDFVKPDDFVDIYLDSFASKSSILLKSNDNLDGYQSPTDRITGNVIKLGTAFHDITKVVSSFQKIAPYLQSNMKLIDFDQNNRLNKTWVPLDKIISDTIIVSGEGANGGGRSGTISADGHFSVSVGANTIDRQSLFIDCAGGVVASYGRDKQGISMAASYDGDVYMEIGGTGIGNSYDSRFANLNDAYRNGSLDIRVHMNGQLAILKIGPNGIDIVSPGTMTFSSQQDMIFRSNSNLLFEGENIVMHAETTKRIVNKYPNNTI